MFRTTTMALIALLLSCWSATAEKIEFEAADGLTITADTYFADEEDAGLPFICLFHQARSSRGEYAQIAPRLVELGYNCMAVDARSGKKMAEVENETAKRAAELKKGQEYTHAEQDIIAALQYVKDTYAPNQVLAWGSSYSASLVLKVSAENEGLIDGTLSFSPNNMASWTRDWIISSAETISHPVFLTSAKQEASKWKRLKDTFSESQVTAFVPLTKGRHGSRALWKEQRESDEYWGAVEEFLATKFPPRPTPKQAEVATTAAPSRQPAANTPAEDKPSFLTRLFGSGGDKTATKGNAPAKKPSPPPKTDPGPNRGHGPPPTTDPGPNRGHGPRPEPL